MQKQLNVTYTHFCEPSKKVKKRTAIQNIQKTVTLVEASKTNKIKSMQKQLNVTLSYFDEPPK